LCLKSQIPSTKLQINHKFQTRAKAIFFILFFILLNFGYWNLFVICVLLFGISPFGHWKLFDICNFNNSINFQQSKFPLGISKAWSSVPGFLFMLGSMTERVFFVNI